jgi:hypothetical protein
MAWVYVRAAMRHDTSAPALEYLLPQPVPERRGPPGPVEGTEVAPGSPPGGVERRGRDRRAGPRVQVALECEEWMGASRVVWTTHDVSTFGLSLRDCFSRPAGSRVWLSLHLPDDEPQPLLLEGRVLGPCSAEGGLRVRFVNPPLPGLRRLHAYLRACAASLALSQ